MLAMPANAMNHLVDLTEWMRSRSPDIASNIERITRQFDVQVSNGMGDSGDLVLPPIDLPSYNAQYGLPDWGNFDWLTPTVPPVSGSIPTTSGGVFTDLTSFINSLGTAVRTGVQQGQLTQMDYWSAQARIAQLQAQARNPQQPGSIPPVLLLGGLALLAVVVLKQ